MRDIKEWRFLDSGAGSAVFHMALDEAIVKAVDAGDSPPTFRLFGWERPSITIGYAQKVEEVIDLDRCERDGIPVARRPTGGRAVFHDRELAFSVVGHLEDSRFGNSLADTFGFIGTVLNRACGTFGIDVSGGADKPDPAPSLGIGKAPCFLSSSRHEVRWQGKKIAGIAQRRYARVFLQQGSILTGGGHERILRYIPRCENKTALEAALMNRAIDLETALGGEIDLEKLIRELFESFALAAGTESVRGSATARELSEAENKITEHAAPGKREAGHETQHRL